MQVKDQHHNRAVREHQDQQNQAAGRRRRYEQPFVGHHEEGARHHVGRVHQPFDERADRHRPNEHARADCDVGLVGCDVASRQDRGDDPVEAGRHQRKHGNERKKPACEPYEAHEAPDAV